VDTPHAHASSDGGILRAWHAAVLRDEVRGLLHLRAQRFLEITLVPCPVDAVGGVAGDVALADSVLTAALRPRVDGGELVSLLAGRLGVQHEPAPLVRGLDQAVRDLQRWLHRALRATAQAVGYGALGRPTEQGSLLGVVIVDDDGRIDLAHVSTADLRREQPWLRAELADIRARGLVQPQHAITSFQESSTPYVETWPGVRCVADPASAI
jgi:hypothetical protein